MSARPDWDAAFRALVRDHDGKPLATLLRALPSIDGESVSIPRIFVSDLAELLDPKNPWNRFAGPPPPDQIEFVDGMPRIKGATELLRADKAALVACARLKKSGKKLDTLEAFEKFARATGDEEALRAFADWRKAVARFHAAQEHTYSAVELSIKRLPKMRLQRLARDLFIWGKMLGAVQKGETVTDAAQDIGEKLKLSDRQVIEIWANARKDYPTLLANLPNHKKRRRRTY
jgi:hypothetical protein